MKTWHKLLVFSVLIFSVLLVNGCRQPLPPDWVYATGTGVPAEGGNPAQQKLMAKRAAQIDAERQLLETLKGMQIDSSSSVNDFMLQNDRIRSSVRGLIRGSQTVSEGWNADGAYEVEKKIDFNKVKACVR